MGNPSECGPLDKAADAAILAENNFVVAGYCNWPIVLSDRPGHSTVFVDKKQENRPGGKSYLGTRNKQIYRFTTRFQGIFAASSITKSST